MRDEESVFFSLSLFFSLETHRFVFFNVFFSNIFHVGDFFFGILKMYMPTLDGVVVFLVEFVRDPF